MMLVLLTCKIARSYRILKPNQGGNNFSLAGKMLKAEVWGPRKKAYWTKEAEGRIGRLTYIFVEVRLS